ncbi:MAG: class I SAM-dependent methyltransferase [Polyangia bacterium]|jgi:ubiquinone/menaquinone biosynthesis C-methylase UbiE
MACEPGGNPLSASEPWNWVADDYVDVNIPLLGLFSDEAMSRVALGPHMRVVDVATGPGTLACRVATHVKQVDAIDFSTDMLAHCQARVRELGASNVVIRRGDGQALPYADATFDLGFSMFGLMFFPDRVQGFRELHRVLVPGGRALVSAWAPVESSSYMRARMRALHAADPSAPSPATNVLTLEDPDRFAREMARAGFVEVKIELVSREIEFRDAEVLFSTLTRGNAPFELLRRKLGDGEWQKRLHGIRNYLTDEMGGYPLRLTMSAFFGHGRRVGSG